MLDRLPPELLDKVLGAGGAPSHLSARLALLWKDLPLVGWDDVAKVQRALQDEDNRRRAMGTRAAFVDYDVDFKGLEALLPQLVGLLELRLAGGNTNQELSVAALTSLSNLHVLDIYNLSLVGNWANIRFPSLVQLHLNNVYFCMDTRTFPSLFRQDAFPDLRALQLSDLGVADSESCTRGFPTLPSPFLAQLDMVSLYAGDLNVLPPSIFSSSTPVVFEVSSYHLATAQRADSVAAVQPCHLALYPVSHEAAVQQSLSELARLCSLLTRPSSLHLPSSLLDILSDTKTVQPLEQACKQHGVELLWYDGNSDDLFFHFWRYAKKLKAQQASGEA
ncbi:hypothetical protein JCM10213v2_003346 [Rhodosporidiobolus nylandii]